MYSAWMGYNIVINNNFEYVLDFDDNTKNDLSTRLHYQLFR